MRRRGERGLATAELAVLAPFALVLVVLLLWVASLGLTQVRARLVARGEPEADAVEAVRRLAPAGSTVDVAEGADGTVAVTVRVRARAPLGFASTVGSVGLDASAVAAVEAP